MQLKELISKIESVAPPELAFDWDRCGIQVAGTRQEINRMVMALDPDEQTIKQCLSQKAQFILTHHPLSIKPRLPDKIDSFYRIVRDLLKTNTILYSAHTSLDCNPLGPSSWLAKELRLNQVSVLKPTTTIKAVELSFHHPLPVTPEDLPCRQFILRWEQSPEGLINSVAVPCNKVDLFISGIKQQYWPVFFVKSYFPELDQQFGLGFKGRLPQPVPFETFIHLLKKILGVENTVLAGTPPKTVHSVSCCPGSGGDLAMDALSQDSDIFITGDLKYHQAQEAARLGCVLDVGHFILEEKMMFQWFTDLKEELEGIDLKFIEGSSPLRVV